MGRTSGECLTRADSANSGIPRKLLELQTCIKIDNSLSWTASRSNLLSRGSIGQANISSRASPIAKPNDLPYYIGLGRVSEDSYNLLKNPNGIIQLGFSENRLSLDLIEKWFSQNLMILYLEEEEEVGQGEKKKEPTSLCCCSLNEVRCSSTQTCATDYVDIVKTARWEYSTRPLYGWGNVASKQKSTAGWLAAFPVFEPHWQICMAGGLSTGWIEWGGERFEFQNAPSYSEKNWGGAFPRKWFWVQCNVFEGASGEVALTAGGGLRQLPGVTETFENAAMIGIHYEGIFYEFVPWNGVVDFEIAPWGHWCVSAENETHKVELEATTKDPGTTLRAPTSEAGLAPACKDTCFGDLRLKLWERTYNGSEGKIILDVTSNMAAVEVGGGPWFNTWKSKTSTPEIVSRVVGIPLDVERIFGLVPLLKPPDSGYVEILLLYESHYWLEMKKKIRKEEGRRRRTRRTGGAIN
ncbi:hypothetical protein HYC85_023139 [Camellia sinensis]|uniref:Tocopherol cyclase n=1 Tax=Camellia sinensis TaxID=4442 RepID=A0A7J7GDS3_CAMSI|nr:hypothetical protein HYC85_023139 [Camellia sinensis]